MAKKKNSRKALAVALGIMGVAGLSLASAAQLTVNAENEVAMGVTAFAPCDEDGIVGIDYTYDNTTLTISNVTVTGIDTECAGEQIYVSVEDANGNEVATDTDTLDASGSHTFAANTGVALTVDLDDATVVIG